MKGYVRSERYEGPERRNGRNGEMVVYRWIIGIVVSVCIVGGTGWMTSIYSVVSDHAERIAKLETSVLSIDNQLTRIRVGIDRIVDRLDGVKR